MSIYGKDRLDPVFFGAMMKLFGFKPVPVTRKVKATRWSEDPW